MRQVRDKINNDGYAVIENFLSEAEVDVLKKEAEKLIKNIPEPSQRLIFNTVEDKQSKDEYFLKSAHNISYFFEEGALDSNGELLVEQHLSLNKIGHTLHADNEEFRKVTFDEKVKETCYQLGLQDPAIVQSMYIFKNPGIGGVECRYDRFYWGKFLVTPHQDASYIHTDPSILLGFWIALEDATIENGCLWFARGSHKSGVHRRYIRNPDKSSKELLIYDSPVPFYQKSQFSPLPVKKGSCVLIHGQVVHFSEANKSAKSRHAYTFHVIEQEGTKYSEDNWIQPHQEGFLRVYFSN